MALEFCREQLVLARWQWTNPLDGVVRTVLLVREPGDRPLADAPIAVFEPKNGEPLEVVGQAAMARGLDLMRLALHRARKTVVAGGELLVAFHRVAQLHDLELDGLSDPAQAYARELEVFHRFHGPGTPFVEDMTR